MDAVLWGFKLCAWGLKKQGFMPVFRGETEVAGLIESKRNKVEEGR